MRAADIKIGQTYAATGKGIQIAKIRVDTRGQKDTPLFGCLVIQGYVYVGWQQNHGKLDMAYAGPGEHVYLSPRDILRPWRVELERKVHIYTQREAINTALSEMDRLLNDMDMPDVQITHLKLPDGYTAVAVLTLDDVRKLHDRTGGIQRLPERGTDPSGEEGDR